MNKKLIVLAVAGALAAPLATMADVEVYGRAHVSVGQKDNDADEGSALFMEYNNSNVGFRGSEDLGGGLSAVYQAETAFDFSGGAGATTGGWGSARDSFVGFAGDWGWVAMGRHNSPYKMSTNSFDIASDTVIDYNAILGISSLGTKHDDRISNAILFKTKDINGFKAEVLWGLDDGQTLQTSKGTAASASEKRDLNKISLSGTYATGPITVAAAYDLYSEVGSDTSSGEKEDETAWKLGLKYSLPNNMGWVAALYELVDPGADGSVSPSVDMDRAAYYVSGLFRMGDANSIGVGYAVADDISCTGCSDTGATLVQVQFNHSMSKMTSVYFQFGQLDVDKNMMGATTNDSVYGLNTGSFKPAVHATTATDGTASFVGVGVVHNFSSK